MKRICFVLLICFALLSVLLTPCFAVVDTTAVETVDWYEPVDDSYYVYHTRSGRSWYKDLPASPAVAPITFSVTKQGTLASTEYTIPAGATFYIQESAGTEYDLLVITYEGTTTSNQIYAYSTSRSFAYYTTTSVVQTFAGTHLIGTPYVSGGSFINNGFVNSLGLLGYIASWMLNDTFILVVIGLAVGVTLIGWGIGKVKSTVKGY